MSFLSEFASMRNGSLRKMTEVKHHIKVKQDSAPAFQHSYRAELKIRKRKSQKTGWKLEKDLTELSILGGARHVVFVLQNDGKVRFCVHYRLPTR